MAISVECYIERCNFDTTNRNEFEAFSNAFDLKDCRDVIKEWLQDLYDKRKTKSNKVALDARKKAYKYFGENKLDDALTYHVVSYCYAESNTTELAFSLCNKATVLLAKKCYKFCLDCVDLCFKLKYPPNIKPKLLVLRVACYAKLNMQQELEETINDLLKVIDEDISKTNKVRYYLDKIEHYRGIPPAQVSNRFDYIPPPIPPLKDGPNESFLHASSAIKLRYNEEKGRHVVADKDLKLGDTIFVEKSFSYAPIFRISTVQGLQTDPRRCFHCLKHTICFLPCKGCPVAIYCGEKCLEESWTEYHRWECVGMQMGFWTKIGIGYPAFRAFLRGIPSGFKTLNTSYEDDTLHFGDKDDNYPYFNKLLTNLSKMEDEFIEFALFIILAIVLHLSKHTDFYEWLLNHPKNSIDDREELVKFSGGLLLRHMAIISNNASVVQDWVFPPISTKEFPDRVEVATAIYPSISMMNHSCKPNIHIYYLGDVAVCKAADNIKKGEEIFNCYGANYPYCEKWDRTEICQKLYCFTCNCRYCQKPYLESEYFDSFRCTSCFGPVPYSYGAQWCDCVKCGAPLPPSIMSKARDVYHKVLEGFREPITEEKLLVSVNLMEHYYYLKHSSILDGYEELWKLYEKSGNFVEGFKYGKYLIENYIRRLGRTDKKIGILTIKLFNYALPILKNVELDDLKNYKFQIRDLATMREEMKTILNVYYHLHNDIFNEIDLTVDLLVKHCSLGN